MFIWCALALFVVVVIAVGWVCLRCGYSDGFERGFIEGRRIRDYDPHDPDWELAGGPEILECHEDVNGEWVPFPSKGRAPGG